MLEKIKKSTDFISRYIDFSPLVGVITGSGLCKIVDEIEIIHSFDYCDIPNFPVSTVEGHEGKLVLGKMNSKYVAVLQGRFHFYEGFSMNELTFPVRVLIYLGIKYLILTNASGGLNSDFKTGDLMVHTDHINMMPNPLIGLHTSELGERFPDMTESYDKLLNNKLFKLAEKLGIPLRGGCYVGVTGPALETPAEYKFYRIIGGDTVGMSTIPEVIVARQMGIRCIAISIITNMGIEGNSIATTHEDVLTEARLAEPKVSKLISKLIQEL